MDILDLAIGAMDGLLLSTLKKVLPDCDKTTMIRDRVTGREYGPFPEFVNESTGAPVDVTIHNGRLAWPTGTVTVLFRKREHAELAILRARNDLPAIQRYLRFGWDRARIWHLEMSIGGVQPPWRLLGDPVH